MSGIQTGTETNSPNITRNLHCPMVFTLGAIDQIRSDQLYGTTEQCHQDPQLPYLRIGRWILFCCLLIGHCSLLCCLLIGHPAGPGLGVRQNSDGLPPGSGGVAIPWQSVSARPGSRLQSVKHGAATNRQTSGCLSGPPSNR